MRSGVAIHAHSGRAGRAGADVRLWAGCGLIASLGLLTSNPLLTAASVLVVPLFVQLLWRRGEPPVLLFLVLFQWLQVTTRVFHADLVGVGVGRMALRPESPIATAVGLGLTALVVLALGQRIGMRSVPLTSPARLEGERAGLLPHRLFGLYLGLAVLGQVLLGQGWRFLPLMQAFGALAQLKWVPLFILGHIAVSRRTGRGWLAMAVALEVAIGFGGYFSGFKTVFFVLILAALSASLRLTVRQWVSVGFLATMVFGLLLVWTGIKSEYRSFLRQGEQAQVIRVSWEERLAEVGRLSMALTTSDLGPAMEQGAFRLAYVDFFSDALNYVPASIPHAGGSLWGGAIRHVLMPRVLFPDKPALPSDSELTMHYTGHNLASGEEGTSISLGYVGESYVDFGVLGMWLPIFAMGLLQGWIYAYFVRRAPMRLIGFGFSVAALLPGLFFETSAVKYLGGTLYLLAVLALVLRFVVPQTVGLMSRGPRQQLQRRYPSPRHARL
jgi:hypothetical protein